MVYEDTSKNEVTWCKVLGHYDAEYDSIPRSRKLRGVVGQKTLYTILRNPNSNRYVLYLYWNDGKWRWNYNWLDNDWNDYNPSAVCPPVSSFLSRFCGRVLFYNLIMPTAKLAADFRKLF